MSLFDGLHPYEAVFLVLGVLFFLLLAVLLAAQILRGKSYAPLLFFFAIPIAMIGFPSFQKIQFQDGAISLEKDTEQLRAQPANPTLRANVEKQVASLSSRPTSDPKVLTNIASAQFALGNHAAAENILQKALKASPGLPEAVKLKQIMDIDRELTTLTSQAARHPDAATKQKLAKTVKEASALRIASPVMLAHVASAQAALGERGKALSSAETALKINPNLAAAKQVKEQVK